MKRFIKSTISSLADADDYILWKEISDDSNADPEILTTLYNDVVLTGCCTDNDIVDNLAYNRSTPKEILDALADRKWDENIRIDVAMNPNTSADTLHKLAHATFYIQLSVLKNPNTYKEDIDYIKAEHKRRYGIDHK
jgi:hypothetical protein